MHGRKVSWTISYHLNNEQNIVPNNAQNNGQNNPQNIVHNNAQFEIQNHPPNAQNMSQEMNLLDSRNQLIADLID